MNLDSYPGNLELDRRRLHRRGSAVLLLSAGVIAWSLTSAPAPSAPRPLTPQTTAPATPAPLPPPPPGAATATASAAPQHYDPPLRVPGLTQLKFGAVRPDGLLAATDLGAAIGPGPSVAVVNVWGTWCEPCVRELPLLLTARKRDAWDREVRFVPIHLGALDSTAHHSKLLTGIQQLVDAQPNGGSLAEYLLRAGVVQEPPGVPLTLVLDCQRRLRWLQIGEIHDTTALARTISELRRELSGPKCASARPPPPPEVSPDPDCGNGRCDLGRENCASCPSDCGCVGGATCVPARDTRPASCVHPEAGLKD